MLKNVEKLDNESLKNFEACAEHAKQFMISVVEAKSPMELAELFYGNSYLRKDMNGDASIFKKSLDIGVEGCNGIYNLLENRNLLGEIYKLAFADYAEKNKNNTLGSNFNYHIDEDGKISYDKV